MERHRMRININIPGTYLSGGVRVILEYATRLRDMGHDVLCYYPCRPYDSKLSGWERFKKSRVGMWLRTCKRYLNRDSDIKRVNSVYPGAALQSVLTVSDKTVRDADIVVATAWTTAYSVAGLSPAKGEKVYFIQSYEIWDDEEKGKATYMLPMKRITISQWIADRLGTLGITPDAIINNGMDADTFAFRERADNNGKISCLMLYHTNTIKGVAQGIEAFEAAQKQRPGLKLIMFGQHPQGNIPCCAEYHKDPTPSELVQLYQQADIFIFPTLSEGWGLTAVEAMACGCALAATYAGCMVEIGAHNENALLSEPGDIKQMAGNIVRLYDDAELRRKLGRNARATACGLSWERAAEKFERALLAINQGQAMGE